MVKNKLKKSNGYRFRAKEVGKSAFTSYLGSHLKGSYETPVISLSSVSISSRDNVLPFRRGVGERG